MSAIDDILDALVRRQIGLVRFGGQLTSQIVDLLDGSEDDLRKAIELSYRADQRRLLNAIRDVRDDAFARGVSVWSSELRDLAKQDVPIVRDIYERFSPVRLDLRLPNANTLASVVTKQPFEGKLLREWADAEMLGDADRILSAIRIGLTNGNDVTDIVRRVIGTHNNDGRDGVTQVTRRNVEAITHTGVMNTAQAARRLFFDENSNFFDKELFLAILDGKTTLFCQGHSGNIYEMGEGPSLPAHWRCRSMYLALFDGDAIGDQPAAAWTEDMLEGLSKSERRAKIKELTGRVPMKLSYNDWLTRQSAEFQDDVLGPKRAKIFRSGALTLDRFTDTTGRTLTLKELATIA